MRKIEDIASTVTALASPGMKPKDLIAAVRAKHPEAGKKEIVRAAFYAAIEQAETDPHASELLHGVGIDVGKNAVDTRVDKPKNKAKTSKKR